MGSDDAVPDDVAFADAVLAHWFGSDEAPTPRDSSPAVGSVRVVVRDLPVNRRLQVLRPVGAGGLLTTTAELADVLGLVSGQVLDESVLAGTLERALEAGAALNGADHVFHLPTSAAAEVRTGRHRPEVRPLSAASPDDVRAFATFLAAAPEDDADEAFVALDHWRVVGAFDGAVLVAAASAYPWAGSVLADIGVLTLPASRGRGLGRACVRLLAAEILAACHEPLYRCQRDNTASAALAVSAGLRPFATWDVVAVP